MAHPNKQPPVAVKPNPRDDANHKFNQIKSWWKKAKKTAGAKNVPLKQFARNPVIPNQSNVDEAKEAGQNWLFNKKANTRKPQLGLGNTHK